MNIGVISLISDDEGDTINLSEQSMETGVQGGSADRESRLLSLFLRKYGFHGVDSTHPKAVVQACSQRPFCLYLYVGVELSEAQTTSVVLVGYLDHSLGASVVRPLLTLQLSGDTSEDASPSREPHSDANLLMEALKKVELRLSNLAVFYCNAPHPSVSWEFVSQLRTCSPSLVSLCGIPAIAARACQAGFSESFSNVPILIKEIHHHYSTQSSPGCALEELFLGTESYNPSDPVSAHCTFIICTVQKMAGCWKLLVDYFKSLGQTGEAERITTRLMDPKVKLEFLFLSQVLQPLRDLLEQQRIDAIKLLDELRAIPAAVQVYAEGVLQPSQRRNLREPHGHQDLLPPEEVNVGHLAREFLWATPAADLGETDRRRFLKSAQVFYKAVLQSLVEGVPRQLEDVTPKNIALVLIQPETLMENNWYQQLVPALGVQFGLCAADSLEAKQLAHDFFSLVLTANSKHKRIDGHDRRWAKMLERMRPTPFHRLLLTLLALPSSLHRTHVFTKMSNSSKALHEHQKTHKASSRPVMLPRRTNLHARKPGGAERSAAAAAARRKPSGGYRSTDDSGSDTDNSSDVVEVTEEIQTSRSNSFSNTNGSEYQTVLILSSEEEVSCVGSAVPPDSSGDLVWGQLEGFPPWPAVMVTPRGRSLNPESGMVQWFGQGMTSEVRLESLAPFTDFIQNFCQHSFTVLVTYREAVSLALQEVALRSGKQFSPPAEDKEERLKQMIDWALEGFQLAPLERLEPSSGSQTDNRATIKRALLPHPPSSLDSSSQTSSLLRRMKEVSVSLTRLSVDATKTRPDNLWEEMLYNELEDSPRPREAAAAASRSQGETGAGEKERERRRGGRAQRKRSSLPDRLDNNMSPRFGSNKKKNNKSRNIVNRETNFYQQPDQTLRAETIRRIMDQNLDIEGFCLCCGTQNVTIFHPLFKGSLCLKCKDNFTETLYRYDEDGYQSYCTVCCYGMEVVLCGNKSCCRSYCGDCVNILVGPEAFESLKLLDPWICYMCQPHQAHGALLPRDDWSVRVQALFANNSDMEFEPHRVYPCIPANLRRPLRVLSLFDGIATGYVVLKELGLKLDRYVASEVCEDSIAVSTVNHDGKIVHVGDVRAITKEHLDRWGPFDLLIGGSPCNDLSIVNPIRKGLYEGTGRLFFDFYRILLLLKPKDEDPRPFFWMFENVVFMNRHDRVNICRFLECNPVLVDAITVSPAHRARYFWGNVPGMNRPIIASQNDKLNLQDCLELGRTARVTKVRTITTNPNSLKQGKNMSCSLPVVENGREDNLWVTELERIFGFPKHYTDVRNMNWKQRQKVLGKAWSVPVVRHLLAPLKDYFACEELPPAPNSASSCSFANSPSPSSPDAQQLR